MVQMPPSCGIGNNMEISEEIGSVDVSASIPVWRKNWCEVLIGVRQEFQGMLMLHLSRAIATGEDDAVMMVVWMSSVL